MVGGGGDGDDIIIIIIADEELQFEAEEGIVPATEERDQEEVRAALCPPFQKAKNLKWRKKRSTATVPEWKSSLPHADHVKGPIEYFKCLLSRSIIEEMVFQSNLYAI
ncbi:hypothetical protein G5714_002746 [Onychostoma macrolepis]|uniref:Uncharacterized protein n=1 Tax=Onychostoma macrolepis TaxID=369639 RepID=A0A7J6D7L4_9TELE|nr:hypothetical protein G5714_002746 [Onychostoma macrolepis]